MPEYTLTLLLIVYSNQLQLLLESRSLLINNLHQHRSLVSQAFLVTRLNVTLFFPF